MSRLGDVCAGRFAYWAPNRRAVAEIQRNIIKRGKRNGISRHFHAKNDKEAITTWRSDLTRILHVFNVRFVASVRPSLTFRIQTELAINTHVVVSDIHCDVVDTQAVVSDIRRDVMSTQAVVSDVHQGVETTQVIISELQESVTKTHTIVSDIHRTVVRRQEGSEGTNLSVSVARTIFVAESTLSEPRLKPGWLL